jgi:preprotein translocase subunit SecD
MTYQFKVILLLALFGFCGARFSATQQPSKPPSKVELRFAETKPDDGLREVTIKGKIDRIYLHVEAVVTGAEVLEARVVSNQGSDFFEINIRFTEEGATKMAEATKGQIGKLLALVIDDHVIVAAQVTSIIKEECQITGQLTKEEAERIVNAIKSR